jgi:hypothetical protein
MYIDKNRLLFVLILLLPLLVSMIAPVFFYNQVTLFRNTLGIHAFDFLNLIQGLFIAGIWFLIVVVGFSYKTKPVPVRGFPAYRAHSLLAVFLLLSVGSIVFHLFDSLYLMPISYKNLFNIISKIMVVSIPLGIWIIKYHYQEFKTKQKIVFIIFFLSILFEYIVIPAFLATPSQSLMVILVVCFSLIVLNYKKRTIVTVIFMLLLFIVASIGVKTMIRDYFYGQVFERTPIFSDSQKDKKIKINNKNYDMGVKIKKQSISDPNFYNIISIPKSMHDTKLHYIVSQGLRRVNHLKEFLYVIRTTPRSISYKGLSTYIPILFIPVPRILFPEKPVSASGQLFGHDYHILSPEDKVTSININPIVEGWVAYGPIGVVFSAILLLIFLRGLFHFLARGNKLHNYLIMSTLINSTLISEAALYGIIGGIFWTAILSFVLVNIMLFLARRI